MSKKIKTDDELLFITEDGEITKAQFHETFDIFPPLNNVLKDILAAGSQQETTRVGDVSEPSRTLKKKYEDAFRLLQALSGTDTSCEQQAESIKQAEKELKRVNGLMELYSHTLYRGTDAPRAAIDDVFSRQKL